MPPWLGSSQRVVTALPRVKKCTPSVPWAWVSPNSEALPAAEAVVGHRNRDRHVDADHADLDLVLEAPGGAAVVGEDGGAVAVGVGVDQFQCLVVGFDADHRQHRAEDLVGVDAHLGGDVVDQGGAQPEPVGVAVDLDHPAAVDDDLGAVGLAGVDVGGHLVAVRLGDQRAHVGVAGAVADLHALARSAILATRSSAIGPTATARRDRHAAFARRTEAGVDHRVGGQIQVGVGQDHRVVLGAAEGLHALAVQRCRSSRRTARSGWSRRTTPT